MPQHIVAPSQPLRVTRTDSGHVALWSGDDAESHAFVLTPQDAAETAGAAMLAAFSAGAVLPDLDALKALLIKTPTTPGQPIRLIFVSDVFGAITLRLTFDLLHQLADSATQALQKVRPQGQA